MNFIKDGDKPEASLQAKAMIVFFHLLKHNYYIIPMAVLGLILLDPCDPPFIHSMTKRCSEIRWNGLIVLVPLLETYISLPMFLLIGTAPIVYNLFAGISSLLIYFQMHER